MKYRYIAFLVIAAGGAALGIYRGLDLEHPHIISDGLDLLTISFAPAAALAIGILLHSRRLYRLFNGFLLASCSFILISNLLLANRGLVGSFLRGNSVSTRYSVYFLAFYGAMLLASGVSPWIGRGFACVGITLATVSSHRAIDLRRLPCRESECQGKHSNSRREGDL